jgi:hypothetical protein
MSKLVYIAGTLMVATCSFVLKRNENAKTRTRIAENIASFFADECGDMCYISYLYHLSLAKNPYDFLLNRDTYQLFLTQKDTLDVDFVIKFLYRNDNGFSYIYC